MKAAVRSVLLVVAAVACIPVGASPADVHLLTLEEGTHAVDRDQYDLMWNRGTVALPGFPLGEDRVVDLELAAFDVVAPGARFVLGRSGPDVDFEPPGMRFFRGAVAGEVSSTAYLWMREGAIGGFVQLPDRRDGALQTYSFGPGSVDRQVVVMRTDPSHGGSSCVAERLDGPQPAGVRDISDARLKAKVAFDTTRTYFQHFFDVDAATAYALSVLGAVSTVYERDLNTQLELSFFRLHTQDSPYTETAFDPRTFLEEIQQEWTTNPELIVVPRSAAQLLHSPPMQGGVANIDTLCDNEQSYSVSYVQGDFETAEQWSYDVYLVAHEFGHVFGTDHTHCYEPPIDHCGSWPGCYEGPLEQTLGTIMSYCDENVHAFHERVVDVIRARFEEEGCVEVAGLPGAILPGPGPGLLLQRSPLVVDLRNDDGVHDGVVGGPGTVQSAWIKRFTPPCHPFEVRRVEVMIDNPSIQPGRPVQLLVYADPTGSGQPGSATLVHSEPRSVQVVSPVAWNEYDLISPVTITAGDVYLGFYDLEPDPEPTYIVNQDFSATGDSFWVWDSIDPGDFDLEPGRTWMVRGRGECAEPTLHLTWSEPCNESSVPGQDFGIYQGGLAPPFDDHSPVTCTTGHLRSHMFPGMPPGDLYFVVVPSTGEGEGGYGTLPPANDPCRPQNVGPCD